jgi:hypothetical protein
MTSPALFGPRWATNRHSGVAGVPEHEGAQHVLRRESSFLAGGFELLPWLVGHAEGAFVVASGWHGPSVAGGTTRWPEWLAWVVPPEVQ